MKEIKEIFYSSNEKRLLIIYSDKTMDKIFGDEAKTKIKEFML